jgi:hypothetical protein
MPIAKRPQSAAKVQPEDAAADAFIAGAGQPPAPAETPARVRKERVMIQFDAAVLARVDKAAKHRGISRSAWIQFVVGQALDRGDG